jgi:phage terminase large subunit-like protein
MNSHGETELLHFPTILDDDVVDIMMGLSNVYVIVMMLRLR